MNLGIMPFDAEALAKASTLLLSNAISVPFYSQHRLFRFVRPLSNLAIGLNRFQRRSRTYLGGFQMRPESWQGQPYFLSA